MTSSMFHLAVGHRVQTEPNLESRDFRECIDQALHEIRPLANERSIQVSTNLRPPTQMHFDHGQMVQVLMNLLENACKFTPKMGHIGISGYPYFWERRSDGPRPAGTERRTRNGSVLNAFRVDVCNTGPEIRPERLNRVFEEYTSYGVGQEGPASGLGLAICKRFVQQHKGRIWAENQLGGPTLSFVLPFQATVPSNQNSAAEIGGQKTIDGDFKKCGQISAEQ
jgi:signal transduction histidine kinase